MQTRHGFVSNSSSSSFVVIAKSGTIPKMLKKEDELTQKIISFYLNPNCKTNIVLDEKKYELYTFLYEWGEFINPGDYGLTDDDVFLIEDKGNAFLDKLKITKNITIKEINT